MASQQQFANYYSAGLVSPQAAAFQLYAAQLQAKGKNIKNTKKMKTWKNENFEFDGKMKNWISSKSETIKTWAKKLKISE